MIKIISDSSILYSVNEGQANNIDISPLIVTINDKTYMEYEEINSEENQNKNVLSEDSSTKENIELAKNIIKSGGCIISEYPIGTKPERLHFPQRNRIISGISNGVLVVEATKKSGALITADFAIEQGKDVYAIPGDINKKESEGCNELIKDGAILVTSYKEILENCILKILKVHKKASLCFKKGMIKNGK